MALGFFPLDEGQIKQRQPAWDGLTNRRSFGWAAIMSCPKPDIEQLGKSVVPAEEIPLTGPAGSRPEWDAVIAGQVRDLHLGARSRYEDDAYPAISIPRSVHGQSQCIAQMFGCEMIEQAAEPGLFYPVPWIQGPGDLNRIKVRAIEDSWIGRAVEFAQYARAVTGGALAIRNPVMTGPIDSANYILGSMQLMRWLHDEPQALHQLLEQITDIMIEIIHALQQAAGGALCPDHCICLPRGFALCSEVRSLLSATMYEEFESPYLRRIGQECGRYMIHSCGTWERTLPVDIKDENLMMVNFQTKEMNLRKVYDYTQGKLSLYVGESINLGDQYLWPCETDFYRHLMTAFPKAVPLSFTIKNAQNYLQAQEELGGSTAGMFLWRIAS
jgi:hypothetical protein